MRVSEVSMLCRILVIISPQSYQPRSDIRWGFKNIFLRSQTYASQNLYDMHASMRASFLFLPSDLTKQRISGLEQLLFLWGWVGRGLLDLIIGIRAGPLHGSGERNREAILAEFFEGDFRDLGEIAAIKNVGDGVAHIEHEKSEAAILLVGEPHFLYRSPSIEGGAPHLAPSVPHSNAVARAWELGAPHWHGGSWALHDGCWHSSGGTRCRDARAPPSKCGVRVF